MSEQSVTDESGNKLVWATPESEGQKNHLHANSPVDNRMYCIMTQGGFCRYNGHDYATLYQAQLVADTTENNRVKKVMSMGDTSG